MPMNMCRQDDPLQVMPSNPHPTPHPPASTTHPFSKTEVTPLNANADKADMVLRFLDDTFRFRITLNPNHQSLDTFTLFMCCVDVK